MDYSKFPIVNGHRANPKLVAALDAMDQAIYHGLIKKHISKIAAPEDHTSGKTHVDGNSFDIDTHPLTCEQIREVDAALRAVHIIPVLRLKNDNVGSNVARIGSEHMHCSLDGFGNSAALKIVTAPSGRWTLEHQLKRRQGLH